MKKISGDNPSDCLFCQWVGQDKAVAEGGTVAAFRDGFPVTPGHLLIVPKRHVADGLALNRQEIRDSEALIRRLVEQIRRDDAGVTGFNIGINLGRSAGQTVMHAHIHLIPRRDGDTDDPKGGVRGVIQGKRGY